MNGLIPVPSDIEVSIISNNGKTIKELSYEDIKKELEKDNTSIMKPQDILVISSIIILSIIYTVVDFYRYIDKYNKEKNLKIKVNTIDNY